MADKKLHIPRSIFGFLGKDMTDWVQKVTRMLSGQDSMPSTVIATDSIFSPISTKVIAGGAITVSSTVRFLHHAIDTEGLAATDDLTTINGGVEGTLLILTCLNAARVTTVKKNATLRIQHDFVLDGVNDSLLLLCVAVNNWKELSRASN